MEQLPKLVRERLAAAQGAGVSAHPDADTLNAFVENALAGSERERVTQHLSLCAECRDVVALSLPEEAVENLAVVPHGTREGRAPRAWNAFHWAGLAASVVVVAAVALLYQSRIREQYLGRAAEVRAPVVTTSDAASQAEVPEAREEASKSTTTAVSVPAAKVEEKPASAVARSRTAERVEKKEASEQLKESSAQSDEKQRFAAASEQSRQKVVGGLVGPAANSAQNSSAPVPHRVAGGNQIQYMQAQAQPVQPPPAATSPGASPKEGVLLGRNYSEMYDSVSVNAARQDSAQQKSKDSAGVTDKNVAAGVPTSVARKPATVQAEMAPVPEAAVASTSLVVGASGQMTALQKAVNWRVSDNGKVERSSQNGAWQSVISASDVRFRTVASAGLDVWAGGSNGALFHSSDGGNTWSRISVGTGGQRLAGEIVHIELRTPRDFDVTDSTGETWTTNDGGRSWAVR